MIPMTCPQCSARGDIPIDKLGMRLLCRKCGCTFYMDASGSVHRGDPADASRKATKVQARPTEPIDLNPFRWIKGLSTGAKVGLGLVLALALGGVGFSVVSRALSESGTLHGRASRLAELFIDMQLDTIRGFATQETEGKVTSWYDTTRSQLALNKPRATAEEATEFTLVKSESASAGETLTTVTMATDPNKPGHTFSYPLLWKHVDGTWRVDFVASEKSYRDSARRSIESKLREEARQRSRAAGRR